MFTGWLPAAACLCAVLCCAAPARAEAGPVAAAMASTATLSARDAEIRAFERAPLSLRSAIMIGETTSHATAVAARFALENGAGVYEVTTFDGEALLQTRVGAETGKLAGAPVRTPLAQLRDNELAQLHWLQDTASVPLRRAVLIAERRSGGKAISCIAASPQGKLAYDTALVKSGVIERVSIDPQSGRILAFRRSPDAPS